MVFTFRKYYPREFHDNTMYVTIDTFILMSYIYGAFRLGRKTVREAIRATGEIFLRLHREWAEYFLREIAQLELHWLSSVNINR